MLVESASGMRRNYLQLVKTPPRTRPRLLTILTAVHLSRVISDCRETTKKDTDRIDDDPYPKEAMISVNWAKRYMYLFAAYKVDVTFHFLHQTPWISIGRVRSVSYM